LDFERFERRQGIFAGVIEVATFAALAAFVLHSVEPRQLNGLAHDSVSHRLQKAMPAGRWVATAFTAIVAVLLGVSLAATGPAPTTAKSKTALLHTTTIHGVSVLTNSGGYACTGSRPIPDQVDLLRHVRCVLATRHRKSGRRLRRDRPSSERSHGPGARPRPPMTAIRSTPTSAILLLAKPTGNDINLNGGYWYEMAASGRVP